MIPLLWFLHFYLVLLPGYSTCSKLVRMPVNKQSRAVVEGMLYVRAVNALMAVVATRLLPALDEGEKQIFFNCTQSAKDNQQYAKCLVPYLDRNVSMAPLSGEAAQRPAPKELERTKRSSEAGSPSMLEHMVNWASRMVRMIKHVSSQGSQSYDSGADLMKTYQDVSHNESVYEVRKSKSAAYFADIMEKMKEVMNAESPNKVVPKGVNFTKAYMELVGEIQNIVREMNEVEELPNVKILSPKLFSIQPDTEDTMHILSPNLLSLYEKGAHNVKNFDPMEPSLTMSEKEALLELVMELSSGEKVMEQIKSLNKDGSLSIPRRRQKDQIEVGNETLEAASALKAMDELYAKLDDSYTEKQLKRIRDRGFDFLRADQFRLLYGDEASEDVLRWYDRLTEDDKERLLRKAIIAIAEGNDTNSANLTQAVDPEDRAHLLLSPIVNAPIVGEPSVIGYVILSPPVYSPSILTPYVLSPLILSPQVFSPVILSPLVLTPVILTPLFISPYVLSPFLISPVILSPMLMTPLILVPKVLTPLIFQPGVMSPDILCPRTLSPNIFSSHVLFAAILSPRHLSPMIKSNCSVCAIIGSPCFMC